MMDFELKLSKPSTTWSCIEGLVMGISYFVGKSMSRPSNDMEVTILTGGLLPMIPYFIFVHDVKHALYTSIGVSAVVLLLFGYTKSKLAGTDLRDALVGAVQTLVLGGIAAGVAYGVVYGVDRDQNL